MANLTQPPPGQRWRSHVDGHTVITGERAADGALWIYYDGTHFSTAVDPGEFVDGYAYLETMSAPVPAA